MSDADDVGLLQEPDSVDFLYKILDQVFDRSSFQYKLFAHKYGLDGLEELKTREIHERYQVPMSNIAYH